MPGPSPERAATDDRPRDRHGGCRRARGGAV